MKITAVHVDTLELTRKEPFVIASSAMAYGPCALVRVETDEGITGFELIEGNVERQRVERHW